MPDNQGLTTGLVQTQLAKTLCGTESTPSKAKPKATHSSFGVPDDGLDIRDKPVVVLGVVGETLLEPSPQVLPAKIVHRLPFPATQPSVGCPPPVLSHSSSLALALFVYSSRGAALQKVFNKKGLYSRGTGD